MWRAALAGLVVLAVASGDAAAAPHRAVVRPALDQRAAELLADRYRRDTLAALPGGPRLAETTRDWVPCAGGFVLSFRYDVAFAGSSAPAGALDSLRARWRRDGYRLVDDEAAPGPLQHLLAENTADGFRLGITVRAGRGLRVAVSSPCLALAVTPLPPVQPAGLGAAQASYRRYVEGRLAVLASQAAALRAAVAAGDRPAARAAWLPAQLTWERVGAAYGSFAELADAIGGLPYGLPRGVADPGFTGLHRIEYGLWHGQAVKSLLPVAARLAADVGRLRAALPGLVADPAELPVRAHEILEDTIRDRLSGLADFGSGTAYAQSYADTDATLAVLDDLGALLEERRPGLPAQARAGLARLRRALLAARANPPAARGPVLAATGGLLETLAAVPGLLELPSS
jgi:hypothetical protein